MHKRILHIFYSLVPLALLPIMITGCGLRGSGKKVKGLPDKPALIPHVEYLDGILRENSGLIYYGGKLWTVNDSGGDPVLYALDTKNGKILQSFEIRNASNRDWESLAQDEGYIYICDVGNNFGRREELVIYKINKDSIPDSGNASLSAEIIRYRYAGREKNNNPVKRSAYDCEAVFALADSLYLFTKDWESLSTTLYTCPTTPGSYEIRPRMEYPADGLITGADISPDRSVVVLAGYREYVPFIWIFRDFNPADYSTGLTLRYEYPEYIDLQAEGIAFFSPEGVFLSCETTRYPAALYRLEPDAYVK